MNFNYEYTANPQVHIVTSTDRNEETTNLLVTTNESVAADLRAALVEADTHDNYVYAVETKPVVR